MHRIFRERLATSLLQNDCGGVEKLSWNLSLVLMLVCFGFIVRLLTCVRSPQLNKPYQSACADAPFGILKRHFTFVFKLIIGLICKSTCYSDRCQSRGLREHFTRKTTQSSCYFWWKTHRLFCTSPELLFNTDAGARELIAAAGSQPDSGLRPKTTNCLELVVLETCFFHRGDLINISTLHTDRRFSNVFLFWRSDGLPGRQRRSSRWLATITPM